MSNIKITPAMKLAIAQGIINTFSGLDTQYNKVYNLLLNLPSVKRIIPFIILKNKEDISDSKGIFSEWISMYDTDTTQELTVRCRRVGRAVTKLSATYGELLPHDISGPDSISILLRVFFIPSTAMLTYDDDVRDAINSIKTILTALLWLELISESPKYRDSSTDWLLVLLENTGASVLTLLDSLNRVEVENGRRTVEA